MAQGYQRRLGLDGRVLPLQTPSAQLLVRNLEVASERCGATAVLGHLMMMMQCRQGGNWCRTRGPLNLWDPSRVSA